MSDQYRFMTSSIKIYCRNDTNINETKPLKRFLPVLSSSNLPSIYPPALRSSSKGLSLLLSEISFRLGLRLVRSERFEPSVGGEKEVHFRTGLDAQGNPRTLSRHIRPGKVLYICS